jgi:hypothetical protein
VPANVTDQNNSNPFQEIRHLCSYLQDLKKASAEEMRRSVYANYAAFIRYVNNLKSALSLVFCVRYNF